MLKKFRYKDITWIDLESPTETELLELDQEYGLHPVVLAELHKPSSRSKVDVYSNFIYLILHLPVKDEIQEIDFIIGKNFIITTHYTLLNPLNDFAKIFETDFALKKNQEKLHAGFIFFHIVRELYAAMETDLNSLNNRLKQVEGRIFSGQERSVVHELSSINHELLNCRWALKGHREVLLSMELAGTDLFGKKFTYYLKALTGEYGRIWNSLRSNRAAFLDLRETNDSLLSIKTNETMRVLAVIAFILLPMTLVSQLFGISSTRLPLASGPHPFLYVTALSVAASFLTYLLAKFKKWI